jgi:hypothetical protein
MPGALIPALLKRTSNRPKVPACREQRLYTFRLPDIGRNRQHSSTLRGSRIRGFLQFLGAPSSQHNRVPGALQNQADSAPNPAAGPCDQSDSLVEHLFQSSLGQHFEKLFSGPHVDSFGNQFAIAAI